MVKLARRAAHVPFAPAVAAMFAAAAAFLALAAPQAWLDAFADMVSLPAPLANRLLFAPIGALVIGGLSYIVLRPVELRMGWARVSGEWEDAGYATTATDTPLTRRKPIFATDELGAPLMSDEVLELQTAQIVDTAPPAEHMTPLPERGPPLPPTIERLPTQSEAEDDFTGYAIDPEDHSIAALIRRLERGMARRAQPEPHHDPLGERIVPLLDSFGDDREPVIPIYESAPVDEESVRERLNALRRRLND